MAHDTPPIRRESAYRIEDGKGEPLAHVKACWHGNVLWLDDLWTHSDHRRKGYARALIAALIADWGRDDLYLAVFPYTDQPLDAAGLQALYAEFGFAATDVPGVMKRNATRAIEANNGPH